MSGTWVEVIKNPQQKSELWQWDTGRQIIIKPEENAIVDEVHFANAFSKDALVVMPQVNAEGNIVADIPNILLWQVFPINIYVVMEFPSGKGTIAEEQLKINPRKKPSDYVYTETEVRNYEALEERIKELEENGTGGGGGITKETDPTVPQWAKEPTKPSYTADEVGAPTKDEFNKLSEDIADLKENGIGTGKYRLINTIVIPEDATADTSGIEWIVNDNNKIIGFAVSNDENGKSLDLVDFDIKFSNDTNVIAINPTSEQFTANLCVKINAEHSENKNMLFFYRCITNVIKGVWVFTIDTRITDVLAAKAYAYSVPLENANYNYHVNYNDHYEPAFLKNISTVNKIIIDFGGVTVFNPGTIITIYGR